MIDCGGYAAATSRRARLIRSRSRGEFIASHKSLRRCTFSQKSALLPNTRARISAVGAVTALRLLHNSLTCLRCTPMALANAPWVNPIGSMNSSTRISPTLAGLRFVVNTAHLTFGTDFVGWAEERQRRDYHLSASALL